MGKSLYDWFLQKLSYPWAEFLQRNAGCGRSVRDRFFSDIYTNSVLILFFLTICSCLFYYYYLNGKFGRYYKRRTYYFIMLINGLLVGTITYWSSVSTLSSFICPTMRLSFSLAFINFLYSIVLFFLLSLVIVKILPLAGLRSTMGYKTPF